MATKPTYEIVTTSAGAISIRDNRVNEIMHNPVGPWAEANALYIDQSRFEERLLSLDSVSSEELVLFDVGLGAAANALAALHCHRRIVNPLKRNLKIISFEKDLSLLEFALMNSAQFDHFRGFEGAIETILKNGEWKTDQISWQLRKGDFVELIDRELEKPQLIFFDPYSPKVNRDMWTLECFKKIYSKSRISVGGSTTLYTYSQATPVRSALLAAGFFVGYGSATGLKENTTQASTEFKELKSPLAERWMTTWKRSETPYPFDCGSTDLQTFAHQKIIHHPQFLKI